MFHDVARNTKIAINGLKSLHAILDCVFAANLHCYRLPRGVNLKEPGVVRAIFIKGIGHVAVFVPLGVLGLWAATRFAPGNV